MKQFSWEAKHKKMETHVGNRTLFMLHGDECAPVKGQYFVERIQINMIFAAALHILYLSTCCYYYGGGVTPLLHVCQDHCNSDVS